MNITKRDTEEESYFSSSQFFKGLEILRKEKAKNNPDDLAIQSEYGDVLIFNKKYQEAIDFFYPLYQKKYEDGFGVGQIIECLIALGKTENDFDWIKPPRILRLDTATLKLCKKILEDNYEFTPIEDLFDELFLYHSDMITFNEEDFLSFLIQNNDKFIIIGETSDFFSFKIKNR